MEKVGIFFLLIFLILWIESLFSSRRYRRRMKRYLAVKDALEEYIMGDLQKEYIYQNRTYTPSSVLKELSDIDQARTTERGRILVREHDRAYLDFLLVHKSINNRKLFIAVYDRASSDEDIWKILELKKYL